ncbi:MAG: FtsB family cell division protein [Longibaculum sp.]
MAKKKDARYKKFIGFIYLGISAILIYTLAINGYRVYQQRNEMIALETRKEKMEKEKKSLSQSVQLLNDDDYVVRYARDKYIFSKDGEEVVKLPESKK